MLYPLAFTPIYKRILWGGRRMAEVLGRELPTDDADYAESWEISDQASDVSRVTNGPLIGQTLRDLIDEHGPELLGRRDQQGDSERFPWLVKYLDAQQTLSVQVHPDDALAAQLEPGQWGKTEAWVVIDAVPGSRIYCGLKQGVDRECFERALRRGSVDLCLHSFEAQPGDFVFVPAGTVHAIGAGVLLAEIQQTSDVTYRLFDWNRVGRDGRSRELHLEKGLRAVDFSRGPMAPKRPGQDGLLIDCDKFKMHRVAVDGKRQLSLGNGQLRVIVGLAGQGTLTAQGQVVPCGLGHSVVVPAVTDTVEVTGEVVLLMCLPGRPGTLQNEK